MSERMQGDRLVVTGSTAGSLFPRRQEAMAYRFEADGNTPEGPFSIEGSVYGRDLRFRGPGVVLGPVLGRGDITFEPTYGKAPQRFLGGIHSSGNVGTGPRREGFRRSPLASLDHVGTLVRGDVIADQVSLTDTVVFGSVRGRRVKLSRCIVFGNLVADEAAVVSSSMLLGYESKREVRFEGPCSMVFPAGTSVEVPAFVPATDETEMTLPCSVMFAPALRAFGAKSLLFRPRLEPGAPLSDAEWAPTSQELSGGEDAVHASRLHLVDWVRHPVETEVRKLRNREVVVEHVASERYILSIAGRALDFEAVVPALRHATWMLKTAIEFDHYSALHQRKTQESWEARCLPDELKLLRWATDRDHASAAS